MLVDLLPGGRTAVDAVCINTEGTIVNSTSFISNDLYLGGTFTRINQQNIPYLGIMRFPEGFFDPKIDEYFPKVGGNGGDVTVNFYGNLVQKGMKVKLVAPGLPDIVVPDSMISFPEDFRMKVVMNLRKESIGNYDVVLTLPSKEEYSIKARFKIIEHQKADTWVQVLGPDAVRVGRPQTFVVQFGNNGNTDAIGVPAFIYVTGNAKVKFKINAITLDGKPLDSLYAATYDTLYNQPLKTKLYWLILPKIAAGSTNLLNLEIISLGGNIGIKAVVNNPLFASPMGVEDLDCILAIAKYGIEAAAGYVLKDGQKCLTGLIKGATDIYVKTQGGGDKIGSIGYYIDAIDFNSSMASTMVDCFFAATGAIAPQMKLLKYGLEYVLEL